MREKQVKSAFLPQDVVVLAAVFAAGAACFLLGEGWGGLGVIVLLCGVMMVPFYHHGNRIEGQKGLFRIKEIALSRENKDDILAYLEGRSDKIDLKGRVTGGALVDVYYRSGESTQFARYFDYADYSKGIEYPLHEVRGDQVAALESFAIDKK